MDNENKVIIRTPCGCGCEPAWEIESPRHRAFGFTFSEAVKAFRETLRASRKGGSQ